VPTDGTRLPIEKRGLRYVAVFWAAISQVLRLTVGERYSITVAMSNVRSGSEADITKTGIYVRFAPES
jgi:hypothetical protein